MASPKPQGELVAELATSLPHDLHHTLCLLGQASVFPSCAFSGHTGWLLSPDISVAGLMTGLCDKVEGLPITLLPP